MLFGSENAENDSLLFSCPIDLRSCVDEHRIFTGRWGTGKSAHLFLRNRALTQSLEAINKRKRKAWYLDENSLDVKALNELRSSCGDSRDFRFQVEKIWKAEIIRASVNIVGFVGESLGFGTEPHWKFVKQAHSKGQYVESVWSNVSPILKIVFGDSARSEGAKELQGNIEDVTTATAEEFVLRCLDDLEGKFPQIAIGIEPIDTPKSPLETADKSMAQDVIAALLNVFIRSFQPESEGIPVYLAIPWHRYLSEGLVNPHKRRPYECHLEWRKEELRKFICSRIAWEFRATKRSVRYDSDTWELLFEKYMTNPYCNGKIREETFDYILRHTHHRPREMQRLCRMSVMQCAKRTGRPVDDIIAGKGNLKVVASDVREAIIEYCNDQIGDFREEVRRKFPDIPALEELIRGISVPFPLSELESRIKRFGIEISLSHLFMELWDAGFVGIEVRCKNVEDPNHISALFSEHCHVQHSTQGGKMHHRWYLFSYNWRSDPLEVFGTTDGSEEIEINCVLHPRTFERFSRNVTHEWPIGV